LVERIADVYAGTVDGTGMIAALCDTIVVVPTDGHDALLTIADRGLCWVPVFTDTTALARFALARGDADRSWPYLTTLGSRLRDTLLPAIGRHAGIVSMPPPTGLPSTSRPRTAGRADHLLPRDEAVAPKVGLRRTGRSSC